MGEDFPPGQPPGLSGSQTVTEIQVTDRLILRCATGTELTLEAVSAGEVSVASCLTATGEGTFPLLVSLPDR